MEGNNSEIRRTGKIQNRKGYAFIKAQETGKPVSMCCAIGDEEVGGKPYSEIVELARQYIKSKGGFERFAEWGLF